MKSEPNTNEIGAILSTIIDLTDGQTDGRTDAGAGPHRTMISASSILAELKMENVNFIFKFISSYIKNLLDIVIKLKIKNCWPYDLAVLL